MLQLLRYRDNAAQPSVTKPTTTRTTEAPGAASIETRSDNCIASDKGYPSPGSDESINQLTIGQTSGEMISVLMLFQLIQGER